ncbi:hypothetical protein NQ314_021439 [Rhamnusium bicolor]|uniref:Uncharacterized protein n=1 Tax=Rhamnusium bicolor TaxID=1586634 RepID=A0AAV8WIM4_9CUCU|nr:hypothetical protein NQ314_021439 [Rhamnusium bicolor]
MELIWQPHHLILNPASSAQGFAHITETFLKKKTFLVPLSLTEHIRKPEPNPDAPSISQDRPLENKENESDIINIPSPSSMEFEESKKDKEKVFTSPELIRPFPKAGERKKTTNGRKGKCKIATDTPEKQEIEEKLRKKENRKLEKKGPTREFFV